MKKALIALIASGAALSSVSAYAQSAYMGAGVTASRYKFDVPNATSADDHSGYKSAGKIFGGYDIDKTWGVEAGYTDFGSKDYSYTANGGNGRIETDSHAFYLAGKASMPINEQASVYGKLGAARNHDGVSGSGAAAGLSGESKTGLYASVGAQYAINQNVSLIAEYEHYGKSSDYGRKSSALSFGAKYNF
ncbi:MAG: outer membrane beta-barrel protein [Pseudomonadota bacterium]